eukprot:Gb_10156 [translate_table: standard]
MQQDSSNDDILRARPGMIGEYTMCTDGNFRMLPRQFTFMRVDGAIMRTNVAMESEGEMAMPQRSLQRQIENKTQQAITQEQPNSCHMGTVQRKEVKDQWTSGKIIGTKGGGQADNLAELEGVSMVEGGNKQRSTHRQYIPDLNLPAPKEDLILED